MTVNKIDQTVQVIGARQDAARGELTELSLQPRFFLRCASSTSAQVQNSTLACKSEGSSKGRTYPSEAGLSFGQIQLLENVLIRPNSIVDCSS